MAKKSKNIHVRNLRADKSSANEMKVERLSFNTGDEKDSNTDILMEVANLLKGDSGVLKDINENLRKLSENKIQSSSVNVDFSNFQNSDLKKNLDSKLDAIREAVISTGNAPAAGGGGGDGGGGFSGGGTSIGEQAAQTRMFASASDFAEKIAGSNFLQQWEDRINSTNSKIESLFLRGAFETVKGQFINVGDTIQEFGAKLTKINTQSFRRLGLERFTQSLELATSGVENFWKTFTDFGGWAGRDSVGFTVEVIKALQESNTLNAYGVLGTSTTEIAGNIRQLRKGLIKSGSSAASLLDPKDASEASLALFALEKRRDRFADVNREITRKNISKQLELAQEIAANTGKTAAEVVKLNLDKIKDVNDLVTAGILSSTQGAGYGKAIPILGEHKEGEVFQSILEGVAKAGGNPAYYLSQNPELAKSLAAQGNIQAFFDFVRLANSGDFAPEDLFLSIANFKGTGPSGAAGAAVISDQGRQIAAGANFYSNLRRNNEGGGGISSYTVSWIRWFQDIFRNYFSGLTAAIGANIIALAVNTKALLSNAGISGLFGANGLFGKGRGLLGGLTKNIGKSLFKKIPLIGGAAGLAFGLPYLMSGNYSRGLAEIGSGLAGGFLPGIGTGISTAIDAGLAVGDASSVGVSMPSGMPYHKDSSSIGLGYTKPDLSREIYQNDKMSMDMNDNLSKIVGLLEGQSGTLEGIERNTVSQKVEVSSGLFGGWFKDEVPSSG